MAGRLFDPGPAESPLPHAAITCGHQLHVAANQYKRKLVAYWQAPSVGAMGDQR